MNQGKERICKVIGCGKNCSLRCPDCSKYQIWSPYCSKECLKKGWKVHKAFHEILSKCEALLQALTQEERDRFEADVQAGHYDEPKYVGERNENGLMHGKGALYWLKGDVFVGTFVSGKKNGPGKFTAFDGAGNYEGNYKHDHFHGYGEFSFPDGGSYRGFWKNNSFHGEGVRVYSDGSFYQGNFENGQRNGNGMMFYLDGRIVEGNFHEDECTFGEVSFGNGDRYIGEIKDGRPSNDDLYQANGGILLGYHDPSGGREGDKILIEDLVTNQVHSGCVIEGEIITEPTKFTGITFKFRDGNGETMTVAVYNYPGGGGGGKNIGGFGIFHVTESSMAGVTQTGEIRKGKKIRIHDPFCKIALSGERIIRVDDYETFEILS